MSGSGTAIRTRGRFSLSSSRALRWTIGLGLAVMVAVGLVLLFLLTQATTNREMYERNGSSRSTWWLLPCCSRSSSGSRFD